MIHKVFKHKQFILTMKRDSFDYTHMHKCLLPVCFTPVSESLSSPHLSELYHTDIRSMLPMSCVLITILINTFYKWATMHGQHCP